MIGISLIVISSGTYVTYGLWMPLSPEELVEQSQTIFVGTVTAINSVDVEYQSSISRDGTVKESAGPEVMALEEYTINVEEFLKNPQDSDIMKVLRATVSGVPSGPAKISGFEIGDRVLFFLPIDEKQTHFPMQYLPESYKIPKYCDAKNVLEQPRTEGQNSFNMLQDNLIKKNDFTANKPLQFVYERDMRALDEGSFDFQITIRKETKPDKFDEIVLSETIHAKSNPCEWIASAKTEFVPQSGEYEMWIQTTEGTGGTSFGGSFSVKDNFDGNVQSIFNSKNGTGLVTLKKGQEVDITFLYDFRNDKIFDGRVYYNIAEAGQLISQSQNFTISDIPKTFKFTYTPQNVGTFSFTKGSISHDGIWGGEQGQSITVVEKFSKAMKFNGQCKKDFPEFAFVSKPDYSNIVCVKMDTKQILKERGWH